MKAIYNNIVFNGYFFENDNKVYFRPYDFNGSIPKEIKEVEGWDELLKGVPFDSAKNTEDMIEYNRRKEAEPGQVKLMVKQEVLDFIRDNHDKGDAKESLFIDIDLLVRYQTKDGGTVVMISKDSLEKYLESSQFRNLEANVITHTYDINRLKTD